MTTAAGVRGWPFAVGVLGGAGHRASDSDEDQLAVALAAYKAGYFLLGLCDLSTDDPSEIVALDHLESLVRRTEAEALFVLGNPVGNLEAMAAELRLVIRRVESPSPPAASPGQPARTDLLAERASRRAAFLARDRRLLGQHRAARTPSGALGRGG